ncbi:DinB family protein [Pseudarthrobacter sp. PH31-O2]|uniref:DinB family protein n=1 Tax=Micrococcaceae TaxID=1268 RepID=UPI0024BAE420|nr:DinB family protein [Pseudarthrobacter sp. PH31-O2]MDJ0354486.1 DinB family protein [Pseudarthrobacter sp. PH31-O2]
MPTDTNDRATQLREYLNDAREAILWKCEGLSDAQARTPLTPTGTHVMGLLLHLAVTESQYFISCLGREIENPVIQGVIASRDAQADFLPPPNMTLADAVEIYRETTVAADAVLDDLELDTTAVVQWWTKHRHTTVERLLVHMIAESHRHAGHLDIVREQLDGFIGLRPSAPNIPGLTPDQWEEQRLRIKELARGA